MEYEHLNCKELSYIYGRLLNNYHGLKEHEFILKNRFINDYISDKENDSYIEYVYDDNKIIGFIHYHLNPHYKNIEHIDKCEISLFVVDPLYRNNGIGTNLLNNTFNNLKSKNINECYLECSKEVDPEGYRFWINRGSNIVDYRNEGNYNITTFEFNDIKKLTLNKKV